jgi:hypothetical protein
VVRLQALLNKDLPDADWRAVAEKLAQAQVAAKKPEATLVLWQTLECVNYRGQGSGGPSPACLNRWADLAAALRAVSERQRSRFATERFWHS